MIARPATALLLLVALATGCGDASGGKLDANADAVRSDGAGDAHSEDAARDDAARGDGGGGDMARADVALADGARETSTGDGAGDGASADTTPARPRVFPGASWATRTPAQVGLDATKLDQFVSNVGGAGVIVRDGYLVRSWGSSSGKFDWASAAKPVIATMLMFAVEEGLLASVDAKVSSAGWQLNAQDQNMTFRQLANMTSGYARAEGPGQAWAYNDVAIKLYAVSVFDRVFKQTPNAAALAAARLGALSFQDGSIFSSRGGHGVSTSPRDFARIGWLWLNQGRWNGKQLLPQSYFTQYQKPGVPATLPRTAAAGSDYLNVGSYGGDSDQTAYGPGIYGFNWWFNAIVPGSGGKRAWPAAPPDTYQANGHWNREVVTVIPSLGIVVAARGQWDSGENDFRPGDASWKMNQNLALLVQAASP
ncbi:MAG: serine hydrolase [Myxococcales bacterium]|nr:serine hydrolase [Myxococcales bacterium]